MSFSRFSCTLDLNPDKVKIYGMETAKIYVAHYSSFCMPQAVVHKSLVHCHQVIRSKPVPIGLLSEEAQESRNKDVKNYRGHFTRKFSRKHTNTDLMRQLLASSDPLISSIRKSYGCQRMLELPEDTVALLE